MVTITIETENAAFSEYPDCEVARILKKLAMLLEDCAPEHLVDQTIRLLDINGNCVGAYVETKDEQKD